MKLLLSITTFLFINSTLWAHEDHFDEAEGLDAEHGEHFHEHHSDEFYDPSPMSCRKATAAHFKEVERGNQQKAVFLQECARQTKDSPWCHQLVRPNPSSISTFRCTYGQKQVHQLIHPTRDTWKYAIEAVKLVQDLEAEGICTRIIYNWWRPEPYNGNVGGAAGRHPYGTSVDVRFCSMQDMEKAFLSLCAYRKQGRLRALGYYGSTGLHLGVGDRTANTWGKSCPK